MPGGHILTASRDSGTMREQRSDRLKREGSFLKLLHRKDECTILQVRDKINKFLDPRAG